jgi:hypothetical protein
LAFQLVFIIFGEEYFDAVAGQYALHLFIIKESVAAIV